MRSVVLSLFVLFSAAGCRASAPASGGPQAAGATSPRLAVDQFMAAVQSQDLQAMGNVWGNDKGPARDRITDRNELERRELVMMCYLKHDRYRVVGERAGQEGRRLLDVEVSRGRLQKTPVFTTVQGPGSRWFVENADITIMQEFCQQGR